MTKFLGFLTLFILMFVAVSVSLAEGTPDEMAKKYGITFPVAELGNCADINECKDFCADPVNQQACIDFAKKHGFYRQEEAKKKQTEILSLASQELGCNSEASCKEFCGNQENWIKCGEFAKRHNLGGSATKLQEDSQKQEMLLKAKEFLGCSTYEECKAYCFVPENREKCAQFSRMITTQSGQIVPPDQAFCTRYPEKCRDLNTGASGQSVPDKEYCRNLQEKLGSSSAVPESIRLNYQRYCLQSSPANPAPTSPFPPITRDEYCKIYPEKCNYVTPTPKPVYDMEAKCRSYPGCTWTGSNCQCSPTSATGTSTVKGVSTGEGLLQNLLHWLGF